MSKNAQVVSYRTQCVKKCPSGQLQNRMCQKMPKLSATEQNVSKNAHVVSYRTECVKKNAQVVSYRTECVKKCPSCQLQNRMCQKMPKWSATEQNVPKNAQVVSYRTECVKKCCKLYKFNTRMHAHARTHTHTHTHTHVIKSHE